MQGGDNPEIVLRRFGGMSNNDSRENIGDEEFYWIENLIPLANGNMQVVPGAASIATLTGEADNVVYSCCFSVGTTSYVFAVVANGDGFVVNLSTNAVTQIGTGIFTNATATPYNNQGLLILTNSAYYDWNITTSATLTSWNNTIDGATITTSNTFITMGSYGVLTNAGISGGGSGGVLKSYYGLVSAALTDGGSGYVPGDVLTLSGGTPESAGTGSTAWQAQLTVTSVSSGSINGFSISNAGSYAGPETSGSANIPYTFTGGSGTGATFSFTWQVLPDSAYVVDPGTGYTAGSTSTDTIDGVNTATVISITTSGIIGGQAIATYAGRVWIAASRTIFVTEVDTYNDFGGSGTNFTIIDSYLHGGITAFCSANNYLYIFGQDSIDALSNVTVQSGTLVFSRINLVTGIGTTSPNNVYGFYRGVFFQHGTGYYVLAGATPERISNKIQGVVRASHATYPSFGCLAGVASELCACVSASIMDSFSNVGGTRTVLFLYFGGKWLAVTLPNAYSQSIPLVICSAPALTAQGQAQLYYWGYSGGHPVLYQAFAPGAAALPWIARTKLWDGGAPLHEKQAYVAGLAALTENLAASGITLTLDTELQSFTPLTLPAAPTSATGYQLLLDQINGGASQYLGLTFSGDGVDCQQVNLIALRGAAERDMLQ